MNHKNSVNLYYLNINYMKSINGFQDYSITPNGEVYNHKLEKFINLVEWDPQLPFYLLFRSLLQR